MSDYLNPLVPHMWLETEQIWECLRCGEQHPDPCVCPCHSENRSTLISHE